MYLTLDRDILAIKENPSVRQSNIQQFFKANLRAIVRAEAAGRVPSRFSGSGVAV